MNEFWSEWFRQMSLLGLGGLAIWGISHKLYLAAECYWKAWGDKVHKAHLEMRKARYESLGVNCHGNCYLFGCKYERITDELHALGYEQDVIERLCETLNRVPHRQPCECGQALLPVLSDVRAAGQPTQPPTEEPPCDSADS